MSDATFSTLFVELDCLVDTRFSVLSSFGDEKLAEVFDENYYTRKIDQFEGIDNQEFKDRYSKRDKTALAKAMGTPIVQMVSQFAKQTQKMVADSPHHFIPRIWINTYPYILNEQEKTNILNSFTELTEERAVVELVHYSKEALTPGFVKQELAIVVMYDYYEWLEVHSKNENFKKMTCPEVTMIGPAIYFKGLPSPKDQKLEKETKVSAFKAMEMTAAPLIGLVLISIENFSMALKVKKQKPATTTPA